MKQNVLKFRNQLRLLAYNKELNTELPKLEIKQQVEFHEKVLQVYRLRYKPYKI